MTDRLTYLNSKRKAGIELTDQEKAEFVSLMPPLSPKIMQAIEAEVERYAFLQRETEQEDDTNA